MSLACSSFEVHRKLVQYFISNISREVATKETQLQMGDNTKMYFVKYWVGV
jgi:predicted ATP-dependent Lon-type protease